MHLQELDLKNLLTSKWNNNAPRHKNVHEIIKKSKLQLEHVGSYYSNHLMNLLEYYWVCIVWMSFGESPSATTCSKRPSTFP
jgi:hypothetical protein